MGRPEGLMGRPGGGGMGRPDALKGGRIGVDGASVPSPEVGRCVGRIVVGPSLGVTRATAGLGAGAGRLRTTRGTSPDVVAVRDSSLVDGLSSARGVGGGVATSTEGGVAVSSGGAGLAPRGDFDFADSSGTTSRRSPSVSARRRIRSA